MFMLCLYWLILAVGAYRNEEVYKETYTSMTQEVDSLYFSELQSTTENYWLELVKTMRRSGECETPLFKPTKSVFIALDLCNSLELFSKIEELHQLYGLNMSAFCNIVNCKPLNQMDSLDIGKHSYHVANWNGSIPCSKYNISVVREHSQDIINTVTRSPCNPWSIKNLFRAAPHQITSVTKVSLSDVSMHDLLIDDLLYFPNLQEFIVDTVPLTSKSLENKLLCYSPHLKTFVFALSRGYLQQFPSHIFNCSQQLSIKTILFKLHNIAYLPPCAFRSAANTVKFVNLDDIGLVTIHKDAFVGVLTLEILVLRRNKITTPLQITVPQSTSLHVLLISDFDLSNVRWSTVKIMEQKHLKVIFWNNNNISNITGMFCPGDLNSKLKLLFLEGNGLSDLVPPLFDNCTSLMYLYLSNNILSNLDAGLFANNVSLVGLNLAYNMLTENVSWSGLLAQQYELKYLNVSFNMLTSWTQNIGTIWKLKQLDISWNQISAISPEAFANLTCLELVSIEGNKLYEMEIACMLPFIHEINLAENSINSVTCMSNVSNARLIDVSSNNISDLALGTREHCPSQCQDITLHAENNNLSSFMLTCSDIQQYTMVDLSNNTLKDFLGIFIENEKCFVDLMNVSWNMFVAIQDKTWIAPPDKMAIDEWTKLHVSLLDMTYCGIQIISEIFNYLVEVSELDLRHNELHVTPEGVNELSNFKTDLHNNSLQCDCFALPLKKHLKSQGGIGQNQILISHCIDSIWHESVLIQSLPDDMFLCSLMCPISLTMTCSHTECFSSDMSECDAVMCSGYISGLSSALNRVKSQIYINGGHIPILELNTTEATQLRYLNLTACDIASISPTAFCYTPDLEVLVLAYNFILALSRSTLNSLAQLRYLDLSHNVLQSFEAEMILRMQSLSTVHLDSNQITRLDDDALDVLQNVQHLSLDGNPWQCSCNSTFKHWIVVNQRKLNQPQSILCNGTGVPVMLSNITCTHPVNISSGHIRTHVVIPSILASLLTLFLVICGLVYKYRFEISVLRMLYLPRCFRYKDSEDGPCGIYAIYDDQAQVAYMWVKDDLIPNVEPACRVICHDRDFLRGVDMMDSVEDAIKNTNCVVLLLTEHFLENQQSIAMIQAAYATMTEKSYKIIPVLCHGVTVSDISSNELCPADLRILLKTHRMLHLSQKLFWESLLYLLPESCKERIHSDPHNRK